MVVSEVLFYFFIIVVALSICALHYFIKLHVYMLWTFQYMYLEHFKKKNISRACSYIGIKHHSPPGHSRQKLRGHAQFLPFSQTSPSRDTHGIHQQPLLTPPLTHLLHPCTSLHPRTSSLACPTATASRSGLPRLLLHLPPVYSPKVPL